MAWDAERCTMSLRSRTLRRKICGARNGISNSCRSYLDACGASSAKRSTCCTTRATGLHPGERPGLGVDIDEELAANYPYRRAYLPINRKLDGTIHSW